MYFEWYPYESFGLDILACGWMSLTLYLIPSMLRRFGDVFAIAGYWFMLILLCVVQRIFLDTESFGSFFGMLRVLSWGLFFFGPIACWMTWQWHSDEGSKRVFVGLGVVLTLIGVDAFLVEPNLLTVTTYVVQDERIHRPQRVVLLADIQTDTINLHTRQALSKAARLKPDLLVYAGDYLQHAFWKDYQANIEPFNQLLFEYELDGIPSIVVEGDAEYRWGNQWHALFEGTQATILDPSDRTLWEDIEIIGLTMMDSKNGVVLERSKKRRFTIMVGHNPNFALKRPDADLYLAGHTHGGQVVLPFLGPLITFSDLPNEQVAGRTELDNGATLIVSQGIGMERYDAPRLRFLCRPEIVVIDLRPMNE